MFITKKKLNELLKDREEKVREEYMREERLREIDRWNSVQFRNIDKRLWEIEEKLRMHDKQDTTCCPG